MSKLIFVPTPIGNLEDITLRAISVLKQCDLVIAEDTRVTGGLLHHFEIKKPLFPFHTANEHKVLENCIQKIKGNSLSVFCSDAGTPGISDPGYLLVRECIKEGIEIECLPGATAFVPALVLSGLPTTSFVFEGFLPHKKGRQTALKRLSEEQRTIVLYESPYRLIKLLEELQLHFGAERKISVSRELSKMFEETIRGTVSEVLSHFNLKGIKGEIVVVIEGYNDSE
jgi:16S rRNA (cytidine1402-2'-O)-methyltransferase